jgi:hypothetical protein
LEAWVLVSPHSRQAAMSSSALFSRPDSSKAVAEALHISKEFGAGSDEAKIAWETVEEMDSSDMAPALGRVPQLSVEEANMPLKFRLCPISCKIRERRSLK